MHAGILWMNNVKLNVCLKDVFLSARGSRQQRKFLNEYLYN